jgi:hypothetical protein
MDCQCNSERHHHSGQCGAEAAYEQPHPVLPDVKLYTGWSCETKTASSRAQLIRGPVEEATG